MTDADLLLEVTEVRGQVRKHKATIAREKQRLHARAAQLTELERECRRRGIALIVHPGVGDIHGHPRDDRARTA